MKICFCDTFVFCCVSFKNREECIFTETITEFLWPLKERIDLRSAKWWARTLEKQQNWTEVHSAKEKMGCGLCEGHNAENQHLMM